MAVVAWSLEYSRRIRAAVETAADFAIVADVPATRGAAEQVFALRPDVVILGVDRDGADVLDLVRFLVTRGYPQSPGIVIVTEHTGEELAEAARLARGVVCHALIDVHLVRVMRLVVAGYLVMPPDMRERVLAGLGPAGLAAELRAMIEQKLTPRELEIVKLVAQGLANAEISTILHLSEATVKSYVQRIMEKLELRNRIGIVIIAREAGLV